MPEKLQTEEIKTHETSTSMTKTAQSELDAGTEIELKVKVACPDKCSLQGGKVSIVGDEDATKKEIDLTEFDGTANETDEFTVGAPIQPGDYTWTAVFAGLEKDGVFHQASSASISFRVKPHTTSMAVWDAPSPIALDGKFKLKVGVSCSANCKLTGQEVAIHDHAGTQAARGILGDMPWSDTSGLYWTELELAAPSIEGLFTWEAKLLKPELELPHEGAAYSFAFRTARPPEHTVVVQVINKDTQLPLEGALVTLHASDTTYRDYTDPGGVVKLIVPKDEYELVTLMVDYRVFESTVQVTGDTEVKVELIYWPEDYD